MNFSNYKRKCKTFHILWIEKHLKANSFMSLKSIIRAKLVKAEFEEVFKEMGQAFNQANLLEEYRTLSVVQTSYYQLKQDLLRNIIHRNDYEVNLAKITNSLVELLSLLPEDTKNKRAKIKALVRQLDIERSRIGLLYMVNCDRRKLADKFWNRFDEKINAPFQFYFLPASPVQMPPSFAERMVWEILTEELEEELDTISLEMKTNGLRLKTADFSIKNSLQRTKKAFIKYFCKRYQASDFEKLITEELPQKGYQYVATIMRIELREWKPFVPLFLEWVLETFNKAKTGNTVFLFFNIIYMPDFVSEPLVEEHQKVINSLKSVIEKNKDTCTVLRGFAPVASIDIEDWFRSIGEYNPNRVSEVIRSMLDTLPNNKKQKFLNDNKMDMVDIEELQEIVYEVANE